MKVATGINTCICIRTGIVFLVAATQQGSLASRVCLKLAPATRKRKQHKMVGTSLRRQFRHPPDQAHIRPRQDPDCRCKHSAADER